VLVSKHTAARLILFLHIQEQRELARGEPVSEIHLPMSRSDIADYVGVSLAAISRHHATPALAAST
jgi:CRP-like cAMP-binding protein